MPLDFIGAGATGAFSLAAWHLAVWPALAVRLGNAGPHRAPRGGSYLPSVEIVMPAYNEAGHIRAKILNLAALTYPRDRLRVTIALDGCTDATATEVWGTLSEPACADMQALAINFCANRGKVAVLNDVVGRGDSELVVLTDVSAMLPADAVELLAAWFGDPRIGAVGAGYKLGDPTAGETAYWRAQVAVKRVESRLGAPMGMHGALWAFRRSAWEPLPPETINDDFVAPMLMLRRRWGLVYDTSVVAHEAEGWDPGVEEARRRRIAAGNAQQLIRMPWLLSPGRPGVALAFASGKALRVLTPFLLAVGTIAAEATSYYSPAMCALSLALGAASVLILASFATGAAAPRFLSVGRFAATGLAASAAGAASYVVGGSRLPWRRAAVGETAQRQETPNSVGACKRAFDIFVATVGLLVTLPFWPLIGLAVKLESRGPVFFGQVRVGRLDPDRVALFTMFKFRTMRADAESRSGAVWATRKDPRITRLGAILRKTRLDELPQLWNVMKGDMSIVGPRPERPVFYGRLERQIPFFAERTAGIRPGITGYAQVMQGYDETIDDVRRKLGFDHAYAMRLRSLRGWFAMDVWIALRTIAVMALGRGR